MSWCQNDLQNIHSPVNFTVTETESQEPLHLCNSLQSNFSYAYKCPMNIQKHLKADEVHTDQKPKCF